MVQPQPKRIRCAFAGDVEMPQAESEMYTAWAVWRDSAAATFQAFITDGQAAKIAGFHVALMKRGPVATPPVREPPRTAETARGGRESKSGSREWSSSVFPLKHVATDSAVSNNVDDWKYQT